VLGLRLVKKTVNQDDVSAYHLFYADGIGSPGTDITFFDWPVGRERRGTNSISRTGFRVADEAAIGWWSDRFAKLGVKHDKAKQRDGRLTLDFEDPEGQRLSLVTDDGTAAVIRAGGRFPAHRSRSRLSPQRARPCLHRRRPHSCHGHEAGSQL
jgi:glyoxalase family protein